MSRKDKLYKKVMNDEIPRDLVFRELKSFLESQGFQLISNGPHKMFRLKIGDISIPVNIPAHNDESVVKQAYIRHVQKVIRRIEEF